MTNPYHNDKRLLDLLERWQSGDFSRADEQELQSLTASDDFRRESAEGFMSASETDHSRHLASLRSRLRQRTGTARRVMFPQLLAAVAAVAILILTVVWLMPVQEKQNVSEESVAAPSVQAPSEESSPDAALQDLAVAPAPDRKGGGAVPEQPGTAGNIMAESDQIDDAAMAVSDAEKSLAVQDVQPTAVPAASMPAAEGASKSSDQAAEYALQEAVQTPAPERAMAKKKETRSMPAAAAAQAQPVGGWTAFNEYLRKNARLPEQARQNNVSGTVRIRFVLDANGKPADFLVLKSLGYGCDEAARQLIELYTWQTGQNNELTVDVPFVR